MAAVDPAVPHPSLARRLLGLAPILCLAAWPVGTCLACPSLPPQEAQALSLATVVARVQDCHPDVRAAAAALAVATADVRTAGQLPNPQLTLGAGGVGRRIGSGSPWSKTFDHQARIDQVVERGGKPALRQASAEAAARASRADLDEADRQSRIAAARAYYDLAAALARRQELATSVALNDESRRVLDRRARAGDAAPLDAVRFGVEATRVQADLTQATADIRGLRLQLATLIGAEDQADALTPAPDPAFASAVPPPVPDVDWRADVVAAQARVAAAEQAQALAAAQRTRDLGVGVGYSRYPVSEANPSGTGNTVSVSVTVPLFVRHAYEGETARAAADLRVAEEALRKVRLAAQVELERARADWEAADARYRLVVEQLLPGAERVAAGAELAYSRGASGVLDVLDARRSLRAAHVERIAAEAERAKAAAQLDGAFQRPGPAPALPSSSRVPP